MIFDTDVIIWFMRGKPEAAQAVSSIPKESRFESNDIIMNINADRHADLLNVIKAEADTYGPDKKYYVTTDRSIRNWLNGTSTPPSDFSAEVLSSMEAIAEFAQKYIEAAVAAGSSELAANAKNEVAFNQQLHGIKLETVDDAELMMGALKDASKRLSEGSTPVVKRKRRPF